MIMPIYKNVVIIQFFILIVYGQGQIPGVKSLKKCNEYLNTSYSTHLRPLTESQLDEILKSEFNDTGSVSYGYVSQGHRARPKLLNFMAAIGYGDKTEKQYLCGGSLISPEFVMTAAHCLTQPLSVSYVRLGDLDLASTEDDQWVQELEVKERIIHPKYEKQKMLELYHDIALLKLNKPAVLNEYVHTICLRPQRINLRYLTLYVAGWGALGYGDGPSSHLQVGELFHFFLKNCLRVYNITYEIPKGIVDHLQICAGGSHDLADTCFGDSGGPLFHVDGNLGARLLGVTSFGKPCGTPEIPGVYTRVSSYIDWIENIVWPDNK